MMSPMIRVSASPMRRDELSGKAPGFANRGAAPSPTKNGATASWSSSARPAMRNCVLNVLPPLFVQVPLGFHFGDVVLELLRGGALAQRLHACLPQVLDETDRG